MAQNKPSLVVLGDGGVGKTSLIVRYTRNQFSEAYEPTLEDNYEASIEMPDKSKLEIQIADTAGQDDYKSLRDKYLELGDVFFIVFSLTDQRSLQTAREMLNDIKTIKEGKLKFVLLGNKSDLQNRVVTFDDGKKVADDFKGKYLETSAKNNTNVTEAFQEAGLLLTQNDKQTSSGGGCCRI